MYKMKLTPKQVRAGATRRRVPGYRARAASNPSRFSKGKKGAHQARMAHTMERFRDRMRNPQSGKLGGKIGSAISVLKPPRGGGRAGTPSRRKRPYSRGMTNPKGVLMKAAYKRDRKKILSRKPRRASAGVKPRTARDRAGSRAILRPARGRGAKATAVRRPTKQFKPFGKRPDWSKGTVGPTRTRAATRPKSYPKTITTKIRPKRATPQRGKNVTRRKVTNRRGGTGPQRNWGKVTPLIRSAAKKYRGYRR